MPPSAGAKANRCRARAVAAAVLAAATLALVAGCVIPSRYTFTNDTDLVVQLPDGELPPGETATIELYRAPCMNGIRLATDRSGATVVIEQRICDGDTVVIGPRDVITDEAVATVVNVTELALWIHYWDADLLERVEPGATITLPLVRRAGGCVDNLISAEARAPGDEHDLTVEAPEPLCDGDTWRIEPEDLWRWDDDLGRVPLHPGSLTLVFAGPGDLAVTIADAPLTLLPGAPMVVQPQVLRAGRCAEGVAVIVSPPTTDEALPELYGRVEACDGDVWTFGPDGYLKVVHVDGTAVEPVGP